MYKYELKSKHFLFNLNINTIDIFYDFHTLLLHNDHLQMEKIKLKQLM